VETRQHSQALFDWYVKKLPCIFARIFWIISCGSKSKIQVQINRLTQQIQFIVEIDRLKQVMRQTLLTDGSRRENSAEHSWHLAVMAIALVEYAQHQIYFAFGLASLQLIRFHVRKAILTYLPITLWAKPKRIIPPSIMILLQTRI
jgi:HD domain